jgi:hypothetical protein
MAVAATQSGLKKNTTLQELMLRFCWSATTVSPILTSLRVHPLLLLFGDGVDLTGLETVLQSDTSTITELETHGVLWRPTYYGHAACFASFGTTTQAQPHQAGHTLLSS